MVIYKVWGGLDKRGLSSRIEPIEVEEKPKCYVGEGNRINKDRMMKIDSMFREQHNMLRFYTFCLEGQQQDALDMIKNHVVAKVNLFKSEVEVLYNFIK
jgi:hypothetical protein